MEEGDGLRGLEGPSQAAGAATRRGVAPGVGDAGRWLPVAEGAQHAEATWAEAFPEWSKRRWRSAARTGAASSTCRAKTHCLARARNLTKLAVLGRFDTPAQRAV